MTSDAGYLVAIVGLLAMIGGVVAGTLMSIGLVTRNRTFWLGGLLLCGLAVVSIVLIGRGI